MQLKKFIEEIQLIDQSIVDLTWAKGLFKYEFFRIVDKEPEKYLELSLACMIREEISSQQKIIIGLSLQKLPLEIFVDLSRRMLHLLALEKITADVFQSTVFPTYDWNVQFVEHYKSEKVIQLLNEVSKSEQVSMKIRNRIEEDILTGKALEEINRR